MLITKNRDHTTSLALRLREQRQRRTSTVTLYLGLVAYAPKGANDLGKFFPYLVA
jgi:hypothetical protein